MGRHRKECIWHVYEWNGPEMDNISVFQSKDIEKCMEKWTELTGSSSNPQLAIRPDLNYWRFKYLINSEIKEKSPAIIEFRPRIQDVRPQPSIINRKANV